MLYLIGLGLGNEKGISLYGLEAIKKCKKVYLENYTSKLVCKKENLEKLFGKKIINADRNFVENFNINEAKNEDIALCIVGEVFGATTHISIYNECKENNINIEVIYNASIITAIGITGLSLYNFGKVASIPFENKNIRVPIEILENNLRINAHTLFLLDLEKDRFLSIKDAVEFLERNNVKNKILVCARLGSKNFIIKYGNMKKIKEIDFGIGPYCLIYPAKKLHFVEEESLKKWEL